LRDEHLATVSTSRGLPEFEIFHDKIRKATLAAAAEVGLRRAHHVLAQVFEERGGEAETIARHHLSAGDEETACRWLETAGDSAAETTAFDRAVSNYRQALQRGTETEQRQRLCRKLAQALARAGMGAESAQLHLEIAQEGLADTELHRRLAGGEYLR